MGVGSRRRAGLAAVFTLCVYGLSSGCKSRAPSQSEAAIGAGAGNSVAASGVGSGQSGSVAIAAAGQSGVGVGSAVAGGAGTGRGLGQAGRASGPAGTEANGGAGVASGGATGSVATAGVGDAAGSSALAGAAGSSALAGAAGAAGVVDDSPRPVVTATAGTTLVKVKPATRHQTFEGWGTSLCWWANHVGGWAESGRNAVVEAIVDPVNGLGYNLFRYNIGGGENPGHKHMGAFKDMPGFAPAAGMWNWNADANQRAILQRILERGTGVIVEAFSNSPPYWMTKSGCASGSADGSNNLKDDSYDAFADYLTEVVKHYHDALGITFRTLEPLNEPNANWWKSNGGQEGCHFSPNNQQAIIKAVAAQLSAKGLIDTTVSASDENSLDDAYNNLRGFDAATLAAMSQINVHSYAGSRRAEVRTLATSKGKRLWQSESGPLGQSISDDMDAAQYMAARIITDLRDLQAEAWVDWQVADPSRAWATLAVNDAQQTFTRLKRFYMHAAFSRFIRPGAVFIDVDNANMVAAMSADGATLALVVRNGDTRASKGFTFDLSALPSIGAAAEAHRTSRSEDLVRLDPIAIQDWSFTAMVPAYSIATFVVPLH